MNCEQYRELVAANVDGALDAVEKREAQDHLATCGDCRQVREDQAGIRARLRSMPQPAAPEALRARVLAALDAEDARPRQSGRAIVLPLFTRRRFLVVGTIAASFALMILPLGRWAHPDVIGLLIQDANAAEEGAMAFGRRAGSIEDLRAFFAGENLGFEQTVPDLSHRGLVPTGSLVDHSGIAPAAVTVYRGESGTVVCRRYAFEAVEIPAGGERFGDAVVITRDGVTMRFVRDGDALCCLASTMPREQFLREMGLVKG